MKRRRRVTCRGREEGARCGWGEETRGARGLATINSSVWHELGPRGAENSAEFQGALLDAAAVELGLNLTAMRAPSGFPALLPTPEPTPPLLLLPAEMAELEAQLEMGAVGLGLGTEGPLHGLDGQVMELGPSLGLDSALELAGGDAENEDVRGFDSTPWGGDEKEEGEEVRGFDSTPWGGDEKEEAAALQEALGENRQLSAALERRDAEARRLRARNSRLRQLAESARTLSATLENLSQEWAGLAECPRQPEQGLSGQAVSRAEGRMRDLLEEASRCVLQLDPSSTSSSLFPPSPFTLYPPPPPPHSSCLTPPREPKRRRLERGGGPEVASDRSCRRLRGSDARAADRDAADVAVDAAARRAVGGGPPPPLSAPALHGRFAGFVTTSPPRAMLREPGGDDEGGGAGAAGFRASVREHGTARTLVFRRAIALVAWAAAEGRYRFRWQPT
ncbi:uncharacterized protein LOC133359477 [Lethenteron reissneri]|uniref:uncharacterized protein LOC133359477 n=1 Tax=Lethenteron reissneri TaxID=7753 RepID=UPI002AB696AB|nr:uncharacterized protein LOC133359477 [Lethenteron reissneri]